MANDYAADQLSAHASIARWGRTLYLLRAGAVRPVTGAIVNYSPREMPSSLTQATPRKGILSTVGLTVPPDHEQDQLIEDALLLRITAPVGRVAPAGTVIFWRLQLEEVGDSPGLVLEMLSGASLFDQLEFSA